MEGDEIYEAQPEVELLARMSSRQRPFSSGNDAFTSTHHPPTEAGLPTENEPLLSQKKSAPQDAAEATQEQDNYGDDAPEWAGQGEFDGLPWWKTPSVGLHPRGSEMVC